MRLSRCSAFRASPKLIEFLRFVVEKVLAGAGGSIKSYVIGVEVLGQRANFDPATNAIVRVTAGRLRQALARYYRSEGSTDPLRVFLPLGTYVPQFAWNDTNDPARSENTNVSDVRRYVQYLNSAEELRAIAEETKNPVSRRLLLTAAADCELMAKSVDAIMQSRSLIRATGLPEGPVEDYSRVNEALQRVLEDTD